MSTTEETPPPPPTQASQPPAPQAPHYDPVAALAAAATALPALHAPAASPDLPRVATAVRWVGLGPVASPELTPAQQAKARKKQWLLGRVNNAAMVVHRRDVAAGLRRATADDMAAAEARWGRKPHHVCGPGCDDTQCPLRDVPGWGCSRFAAHGVCASGCPFPHIELTRDGELWVAPLDEDVSVAVQTLEGLAGIEGGLPSLVVAAAERAAADRAMKKSRAERRA